MAGMVIRLVPMTYYEWTNVQAGESVETMVASHIEVSQYRHATLAIRVHSFTIPGDGNVFVIALPDGHTQDDPSSKFLDSDAMQSVQIAANDEEPFYRTLELTAGRIGSMIAVGIGATMDSSTPAQLDATISIDLVLKD